MSKVKYIIPALALLIALCSLTVTVEPNVASRLATVQALVEQGTFVIGDTQLGQYTCDKVYIEEEFYSSKPPLQSIVMAAIYYPLYHVFNITIDANLPIVAGIYGVIFGVVPLALLFYLLIGYSPCRALTDSALLAALLCICFGTIMNGYGTTVTNNLPSALLAYYAFLLFIDEKRDRFTFYKMGFAAGICASIAVVSGGLFLLLLGVFLLLRERVSSVLKFSLAALPPVLFAIAFYFHFTGKPIPFYLQKDLYDYPGTIWSHPTVNGDYNDSWYMYLFHLSFGHHGFYSMMPVFLLSTLMLFKLLPCKEHPYEKAAFFVLALTIYYFILFTMFTDGYSGLNVGNRWFMILMPLHLHFLMRWIQQYHRERRARLVLQICLAVSMFNCLNSLAGPWRESLYETVYRKFFAT